MLVMAAVREIKARHLHPQMHEVSYSGFRVAGGPQRAYDLRLAGTPGNNWFQAFGSADQSSCPLFLFRYFWIKLGVELCAQ